MIFLKQLKSMAIMIDIELLNDIKSFKCSFHFDRNMLSIVIYKIADSEKTLINNIIVLILDGIFEILYFE